MGLRISQTAAMRANITVHVTAADRKRLEALVADRNTAAKVVWRAEIVLATADGLGTNAIMRRTGKSKPCVWRWQERFAAEGVDGLLRDKTRPPGKKPLSDEVKRKVLTKTAQRDAAECHALERPQHGESGRHQPHQRAAHLGRGRPEAAPGAPVQDLERPAVRGEGHRRRRPLHEPAGQGSGAVRRREKPDPGARSHAAGPADEEGPRRNDDARLQAPRHDDAVRGARRQERLRHR